MSCMAISFRESIYLDQYATNTGRVNIFLHLFLYIYVYTIYMYVYIYISEGLTRSILRYDPQVQEPKAKAG